MTRRLVFNWICSLTARRLGADASGADFFAHEGDVGGGEANEGFGDHGDEVRPDLEKRLAEGQVRRNGAILIFDERHDVKRPHIRVHEHARDFREQVEGANPVKTCIQPIISDE